MQLAVIVALIFICLAVLVGAIAVVFGGFLTAASVAYGEAVFTNDMC